VFVLVVVAAWLVIGVGVGGWFCTVFDGWWRLCGVLMIVVVLVCCVAIVLGSVYSV
jgi:hypothetical protein